MNQPTSNVAQLRQGPIAYREMGEGKPIVFVHGYLVDGHLWDGVAERLSDGFRCILPDWPMGSHRRAMAPDADLSPPGMARIIADFLAELDLDDVTIVGNDSGGAVSQVLATKHPERIGRLVLTNCDTHENFPPSPFGFLPKVARVPGVVTALGFPLRFAPVRRAAFKPFARTEVSDELLRSWVEPGLNDADIRRDTRKFSIGLDKRHTLEAAEALPRTGIPLLLVWAARDRFFPIKYAERLANAVPGARLEPVEDSRTFVPLDQPARAAELIREFARERTREPARA